jgi:hypothetical protein
MNLNEYNITRGGLSATKIDEEAHKFAKIFAKDKGFDLEENAVVTKSLKVDYKKPIYLLSKTIFSLDSAIRFDKNRDISIFCSLKDKNGTIGAKGHLTFTIVNKKVLESKVICLHKKKKEK